MKPDIVLLDETCKEIYVVEFYSPAESNWNHRKKKVKDSMFEMKSLYAWYRISMVGLIIRCHHNWRSFWPARLWFKQWSTKYRKQYCSEYRDSSGPIYPRSLSLVWSEAMRAGGRSTANEGGRWYLGSHSPMCGSSTNILSHTLLKMPLSGSSRKDFRWMKESNSTEVLKLSSYTNYR